MINFGDVFRYNEELYVYLVQIDDITFAAKIISKEVTDAFVRLRDTKSKTPGNKTHERTSFCFVVLSSDEFRGQAAHYGRPQMPAEISEKIQLVCTLNKEDIELLKSDIKEDVATFEILRKTISELFRN